MILRLVVGTNITPKSSTLFYTVLPEGQFWCQVRLFRDGAVEYSMQAGAPFLHPFLHGSGFRQNYDRDEVILETIYQ